MLALLQVALTNLLLSSDNVLAIALLSHGVRHGRRLLALLWSLAASLAWQLGILAVVAYLFRFTYLQVGFGAVICYMAFHLLGGPRSARAVTAQPGLHRTVLRITVGNLMVKFRTSLAHRGQGTRGGGMAGSCVPLDLLNGVF